MVNRQLTPGRGLRWRRPANRLGPDFSLQQAIVVHGIGQKILLCIDADLRSNCTNSERHAFCLVMGGSACKCQRLHTGAKNPCALPAMNAKRAVAVAFNGDRDLQRHKPRSRSNRIGNFAPLCKDNLAFQALRNLSVKTRAGPPTATMGMVGEILMAARPFTGVPATTLSIKALSSTEMPRAEFNMAFADNRTVSLHTSWQNALTRSGVPNLISRNRTANCAANNAAGFDQFACRPSTCEASEGVNPQSCTSPFLRNDDKARCAPEEIAIFRSGFGRSVTRARNSISRAESPL